MKVAGEKEFLKTKFDTGDPLRMYVAFRIWNAEESLVTDWLRMLLMLLQAKSWQKKELL